MIMSGKISGYDGNALHIIVPFNDTGLYIKRQLEDVEVRLDDGRTISNEQRKHIYATINDIALYTGFVGDEVKSIMKYEFISKTGCDYFSLATVDLTTAKEFLQFMIEFCIENDISTNDNPLDRSPDIARTIYICALYKKCCLCGGKAEIHHEHAIGIGRNRKEIIHLGMQILPLCRKHHTEAHTIGQKTFNDKYHVFGIKADKEICIKYNLKR